MGAQLQFDFDTKSLPAGDAELPRDPLERGYAQREAERTKALREVESRFGVVLNRRVRVTLSEIPGEFDGRLLMDELFPPTRKGSALRLRLGAASFEHTDIETCVVIEDA
ncbi:MAG: hypothetical protein V1929_04330 [bacterium]